MQGQSMEEWKKKRGKGEGRCWRREEKDPCVLSMKSVLPREIFDPDSVDIPRGSKIGYIGFREELLRQRLWIAINLLYFQRPISFDFISKKKWRNIFTLIRF